MEIHPTSIRHVSHPATGSAAADDNDDPMHAWWESISKARSRIQALTALLPDRHRPTLSSLADSDRPALSLLLSPAAYSAVSSSLSLHPSSGSGSDPLCHWLYDTYLLLPSDPHLPLVSLSFLPLLSGLYLLRLHRSPSSPSLAGFEAVLLAVYSSEVKARGGKPNSVAIPDLSLPSLYHSPRVPRPQSDGKGGAGFGVLSRPLELQSAVKSTKRACIVGTALEVYYKSISQMPPCSKVDFCRFAAAWAGQECCCRTELDGDNAGEVESIDGFGDGRENGGEIVVVSEGFGKLEIEDAKEEGEEEEGEEGKEIDGVEIELQKGGRIPLPWELLQPMLRILGHCLLAQFNPQEVKDAASVAVKSLYARASHDLVPQAILATRSLIRLDNRAREAAKAAKAAAEAASVLSNVNTPSKAKKPEILLVSK